MAAPYNPRKIDDHDLAALRRSLRFFGAVEPIIANRRTGRIVGGHQRVKAAQAEGLDSLPVAWVDLDDPSEKQLNLALNRISGDWDDAPLRELLKGLEAEGADLAMTGFDDHELAKLIQEPLDLGVDDGSAGHSALPEPEQRCEPGDVWQIGKHRLICGDATSSEDVDRLLEGRQVTLGITSPPYAQQREYDTESGFEGIHPDRFVEWFADVADNVSRNLSDDGSWLVNIKEHCEDGQRVLYVRDLVLAHVREWGWRFVDEFIWSHGGTPKTPAQRFKNGWEPIFHFARGRHKFYPDRVMHPTDDVPDWSGLHPNMEDVQEHGFTEGMRRKGVDSRKTAAGHNERTYEQQGTKGKTGGYRNNKDAGRLADNQGKGLYNGGIPDNLLGGMAYPSNVLTLGKNRDALGHPAAFPVSMPDFFIRVLTDPGDVVFDPFMGSGSTMVASAALGRECLGIELSPKYCDIVLSRCEAQTNAVAAKV